MGISPKQFAELQKRAQSGRTSRDTEAQPVRAVASGVILGIDPSLRGTGFGVIRFSNDSVAALDHGTIGCPANWRQSRCLARIAEVIREVVSKHSPDVCAVEGLFHAKNVRTALIMGQARGAALAMVAQAGLDIFEISPRKVKQAIVGYGAAQKGAVAVMIQRRLNLAEPPAPDAADALAIALTHAQSFGRISAQPPEPI